MRTIHGNVNGAVAMGKTVWWFLKNLNTELLYNTAISVVGIYPKRTESRDSIDTCSRIFIAELFTIARSFLKPSVHPLMRR